MGAVIGDRELSGFRRGYYELLSQLFLEAPKEPLIEVLGRDLDGRIEAAQNLNPSLAKGWQFIGSCLSEHRGDPAQLSEALAEEHTLVFISPWERVVFRIITSDPTRVASLLAGEVRAIENVPTADLAKVAKNSDLSLYRVVSLRVMYVHLDSARDKSPFVTDKAGRPLEKNPLKDVRVRRAISKAINRQALVERVDQVQTYLGLASRDGLLGLGDERHFARLNVEFRRLERGGHAIDVVRRRVHGPDLPLVVVVVRAGADGVAVISAICAAPALTLGAWGMLDGKRATCYPAFEAKLGPAVGRLAVESRFWPLYEVVDGRYRLTYEPRKPVPVEEWLRPQARFAHLFRPGAEGLLAEIQRRRGRWAERGAPSAASRATSSGTSTWQAPGFSDSASLNALRITSGITAPVSTRVFHLVSGRRWSTMSTRWWDSL